jgi:hypothetical protein
MRALFLVNMKTLARERDRVEILSRLRSIRPDRERLWGRMSIHQMVCHLEDSFRMALGQKSCRPDTTWLRRTVVKWFALYAPLPWPAGVPTSPEIDQEREGSPPADFEADLAQLVALFELVTAKGACLEGQPHPFFGRMSHPAWLRWGYLHANHHLSQFGA